MDFPADKRRIFKTEEQKAILLEMFNTRAMTDTKDKKLITEASLKTNLPFSAVKDWISNHKKGPARGQRKKKNTEDLNLWTSFLSMPAAEFHGDPSGLGMLTKSRSERYQEYKTTPEGMKQLTDNLKKQRELDPKNLSKQQVQNRVLGLYQRVEKETSKLDKLGFKAATIVAEPEGRPTVLGPVGALGFFRNREDILDDYVDHMAGKKIPNDRRDSLRLYVKEFFKDLYAKLTGRKGPPPYGAIMRGEGRIKAVGMPCPFNEIGGYKVAEMEAIIKMKHMISLKFREEGDLPPANIELSQQLTPSNIIPSSQPPRDLTPRHELQAQDMPPSSEAPPWDMDSTCDLPPWDMQHRHDMPPQDMPPRYEPAGQDMPPRSELQPRDMPTNSEVAPWDMTHRHEMPTWDMQTYHQLQPLNMVTSHQQQPPNMVTSHQQQPQNMVTSHQQQPQNMVTSHQQQPQNMVTSHQQQPQNMVTSHQQQPSGCQTPPLKDSDEYVSEVLGGSLVAVPKMSVTKAQHHTKGMSAVIKPQHPVQPASPEGENSGLDDQLGSKRKGKVSDEIRIPRIHDRLQQRFLEDPICYIGTITKIAKGRFTITYDGYPKEQAMVFTKAKIIHYMKTKTLKLI